MATLTVEYTALGQLSCSGCQSAEVRLCVPPEKVAPVSCDPAAGDQPFEYHTIPALLVKTESFCKYNETHYQYTFAYSDVDVAPGEVIECADIQGVFCEGCLTDYIRDVAGNEVVVETNGGSQTLITQHGCEYPLLGGGGGGTPFNNFIFADGSDGDLTVLNGQDIGLPFIARNYYFQDLTIDDGGILHPWGDVFTNPGNDPANRQYFQIFVNGTLTVNGQIAANANPGASAVGQPNAPSTDEVATDGPGGGDCRGAAGGDGALIGGNGFAGVSALPDRGPGAGFGAGGFAGAGGAGGDAGAFTGGAGGPFVEEDDYYVYNPYRYLTRLWDYSSGASFIAGAIGGGAGGAGGGGGAGATGADVGGGGGAGASGSGSIYIAARNIVIGGTGSITALGANGGNGGDGASGGGAAGGGGGGGGSGGGLVYLIYESFINSGSIDVSGGLGGSGGSGAAGGAGGAVGSNGLPGNIVRINLTTGNFE